MFYRLVYQNAKRSRRENLIYFLTLVTAVASFYLVLSLERQDVIAYLKTFESEALDKLFALMPVLYAVALLLVASLALFANRYQLDRRSREFGLYLMFGMRRRRLFLQLLCEGAITSCFALISGIVVGGLLSELISLVTSRLAGQGIIGHQLSFSLEAAGWTALGFLVIQLVVSLLMVARLSRRELHGLLYGSMEKKQRRGSAKGNLMTLLVGAALLGASYAVIARFFVITASPTQLMLATLAGVILCVVGTLVFIRGTTRLVSLLASSSRQRQARGLRTFTLRQFQEFIANKPGSVTAASFLMFFALLFLSAGASIILSNGTSKGTNVYDFTIVGEDGEIERVLASPELAPYVSDVNRLEIGHVAAKDVDGGGADGGSAVLSAQPAGELGADESGQLTGDPGGGGSEQPTGEAGVDVSGQQAGGVGAGVTDQPADDLDWSSLRQKLVAALPAGVPDPALTREDGGYSLSANDPEALYLLNLLDYQMQYPNLIPESSYARLLAAAGLEPLRLGVSEVAFYLNPTYLSIDKTRDLSLLKGILQQAAEQGEPLLRLADQSLNLAPLPPMRDLVTDRSVTIAFALIVPDALFEQMVDPLNSSVYWNFRIPPALTAQLGTMVPIKEASDLLAASGLEYESSLQNSARQLFYVVAGSYTLLYLGFLFLLIGCTVLALQFLTQARQTNRRYLTLSMLGAGRAQMRRSLYVQVAAYFLLPLALACLNAIVGLWTLLSFIYPYLGGNELLYPFAIAMAGAVILIEALYALVAARSASYGLERLLGHLSLPRDGAAVGERVARTKRWQST